MAEFNIVEVDNVQNEDLDTGAGEDQHAVVGIVLPADGGAVVGGTASDPIRTDPTGTTTQPVSDAGGSLTVDATSWPLPTGAATETTLATLATETKLEAVRALLASLDGKDYATQTTLAAILVDTGQIEALLTSLDGKDFATDTVLQAVRDRIGEAVASPTTYTLLDRLQTVIDRLTSIKDTDGVQIIDDIIRLGDTARNGINSILNNSIRRLETRGSVTSPDGVTDADVGSTATANNRLSVASRLTDGTGFLSTILQNSIRKLEGRFSLASSDGTLNVDVGAKNSLNHLHVQSLLRDGTGSGRVASIDSSNRLLVSANVTVPPASVAVDQSASSNLSGTSDTTYLIPSGKILTIARFASTVEANSGRVTRIQLYYDPAGTGSGMTLIREMFMGSGDRNYEFQIDFNTTGDGTKLIRMRRERMDGGADNVSAFWSGFRDA